MLLNASQAVSAEWPFLLVLAGTPNLENHLNAMGVTFWSRALQLRVGRLTETASAEAIRRPFAEEGIRMADDALVVTAEVSQRYPYFVQLLGDAVWGRVVSTANVQRTVARQTVHAALPEFESDDGGVLRPPLR